jgi:hypothetical protein
MKAAGSTQGTGRWLRTKNRWLGVMKSLAMEAEGVSALQRRFCKSNAVVNERNQGDL